MTDVRRIRFYRANERTEENNAYAVKHHNKEGNL